MKKAVAVVLIFLVAFVAVMSQNRAVTPGVDVFNGSFIADSGEIPSPLTLWYRRPSADWNAALPVGNGRLGAMIFGGVEGERLQLNEDTLWSGGPYDPNSPEALAALPEVRRLIFAGQYNEAEKLIQDKMMARPIRQMSYQTIGDLRLAFPRATEVYGYRRELDIDAAISRVTYVSNGVKYTREVFASAPDDVIVMRLTADKKGAIDVAASFQSPQKSTSRVENSNELVLSGVNSGSQGIDGKLRFETRAKFLASGGKVTQGCESNATLASAYSNANESANTPVPTALPVGLDGCVTVKGADSLVILISAATSYKRFDDVSGDEKAKSAAPIKLASKKTFETLKTTHVADYRKLFRRVSLDLGGGVNKPTDERIAGFASGGDPALAALYFQYGRYLLISSSRPGTQPANLQGIWNDSTTPPWNSKYTININTEMNYWPAEMTNLSELTRPLADLVSDIAITGAKTAKSQYGARGWVTHHNTDLWRATAPIDAAFYGTWPTGGAWLTTHLWEHYEYTQDRAFLARSYPIMKGAAEFFSDFLVEDPRTKYLVTAPSMSPENRHKFGTSISAGPTMDEQIVRDLFDQTIAAAEVLGVDAAFRQTLAEKRARLAPNKIGAGGQLQEWQDDWDLEAKDPRHRHVSHLYGAYPSWQINRFDTPELVAGVKKTLETRGDESTGWATAWRLNLWARLGDAEHAYKILGLLLGPERTYPNMFDAHPPFQIDGNFGGTSGIAEMLVQSRIKDGRTEIEFLPALPKAFANGSVRGIRARGGFEIDASWKDGKITTATIKSLAGTRVAVRENGTLRELKIKKGATVAVVKP